MPIKAEPNAAHNNSNLNNLMSRASSLLNINHANVSTASNNNSSSKSNKSNHQATAASAATAAANANANIQLSSQTTVANEKFNRIDGGEQQIIVSIAIFFLSISFLFICIIEHAIPSSRNLC